MLTKLCGFTDENSVKTAITQKCDFLGFVFYEKSPRFIIPKKAASISLAVPSNIFKVAVIVNPEVGLLEKIAEDFSPDFFQFHGNEDAFFLGEISKKFPKIKIYS